MNYLEVAGILIGLIYLVLEYKASVWLWPVSIAMPAIYIFIYYDAGLYADMGISIYYILASIYGLICWLKGSSGEENDNEVLKISHIPGNKYLPLVVVSLLIFTFIGFILSHFTDSTVPWADSFTTALSIIAMWLLARKYVEQWILWIIADIACGVLYFYKSLYLTGLLYILYAVIAVFGYRKWLKMMN